MTSSNISYYCCQKLSSIAKELKAGFVIKAEGVVVQRTKENVKEVRKSQKDDAVAIKLTAGTNW